MIHPKFHSESVFEQGSVLVLTLWTLFFLSALAVAVAAHVEAEMRLARWVKVETMAYQLSRAGVERGIMEVMKDTNDWDASTESWAGNESIFRDAKLDEGTFSLISITASSGGGAATNYGLIDEEKKVNINKASSNLLASLVTVAGGVDSMAASDVASAVIDWRSKHDDVLTGGAENNYYQALDPPMPCHNGEFQLVHELLLVRGITAELFVRIEPYVTIYGSGKINVNTADEVVLKSLGVACGGEYSVCESLAGKIVKFRDAGNVFSKRSAPGDMIKQVKGVETLSLAEESIFSSMLQQFFTLQSTCFRGMAEGKVNGQDSAASNVSSDGHVSRITFVFDRIRRMKLYWHED